MKQLEIGAHATLTHVIQEHDSARQWGNNLPVLATPVLLWLAEIAAMNVIEPALSENEMSVGVAHDAKHLTFTPIGSTISITAQLLSVERRRLCFRIEAQDEEEVIYQGTHERGLVAIDRFQQRISQKQERLLSLQ